MNQLTLTECSKKKLDETYLVVYAIKNELNIKKGDCIFVPANSIEIKLSGKFEMLRIRC